MSSDTFENTDKAEETGDASINMLNGLVLGINPALSIDQTLMAQAGAQGQIFANMVAEQQRQMTQGTVNAIQIARKLYNIDVS